jgi:hypothetical protein
LDGQLSQLGCVRASTGPPRHRQHAQRFFRLPWIGETNLSFFKNVAMGGNRRIQIRWESYNLLNTVNWSNIDTSAQFNPAGGQVDLQFGKAAQARDPRIMQGAVRFSF